MSTRLRDTYDFIETDEQREARLRVRAFHFARYRGVPQAAVKSTGPGAPEPQEWPVTPSPSSPAPRYRQPSVYPVNSQGKKSHHKPNPDRATEGQRKG